jgi:hypothetical protein
MNLPISKTPKDFNTHRIITGKQSIGMRLWLKAMDCYPQLDCPKWFLKVLDKVIPDGGCPLYQEWYIGNQLIVYIPQLCGLNPFYKALVEHRMDKIFTE